MVCVPRTRHDWDKNCIVNHPNMHIFIRGGPKFSHGIIEEVVPARLKMALVPELIEALVSRRGLE